MTQFETYLQSQPKVNVIGGDYTSGNYVALDLSTENVELNTQLICSSDLPDNYIDTVIAGKNGLIGYGGYLETRNLYQRSNIFNGEMVSERNIHIGIDLWISAGTPILAALDGTIHSFAFNSGLGNYGPTIILEHEFGDSRFYTLYGHLSAKSIENLKVGAAFAKGEQIATLGDRSVNGDYPPHLHFQIIKEINGMHGDYPGVCSINDIEYYKNNCPDPNLLLKLY